MVFSGLPVNDIDLAVDRDPHWVMNLLHKHHIKAIPTGIDHGTVTAVLDKRPYKIKTLRVDVKTFGRKAHVAFTEDWVQDALRRDFTINAFIQKNEIMLNHGLKDLWVQFIGKASLRIKKDYLRILRFSVFLSGLAENLYDGEGLQACRTLCYSPAPACAREGLQKNS